MKTFVCWEILNFLIVKDIPGQDQGVFIVSDFLEHNQNHIFLSDWNHLRNLISWLFDLEIQLNGRMNFSWFWITSNNIHIFWGWKYKCSCTHCNLNLIEFSIFKILWLSQFSFQQRGDLNVIEETFLVVLICCVVVGLTLVI